MVCDVPSQLFAYMLLQRPTQPIFLCSTVTCHSSALNYVVTSTHPHIRTFTAVTLTCTARASPRYHLLGCPQDRSRKKSKHHDREKAKEVEEKVGVAGVGVQLTADDYYNRHGTSHRICALFAQRTLSLLYNVLTSLYFSFPLSHFPPSLFHSS